MESNLLIIAETLGAPIDNLDALSFVEFAAKTLNGKELEIGAEIPLEHGFTPGLYSRTMIMAPGTFLMGMRHLTHHQFVLSAGSVFVWTESDGMQALVAPHIGETKPGTYRMGFSPEGCVWTTFHATDLIDPDEIKDSITSPPLAVLQ